MPLARRQNRRRRTAQPLWRFRRKPSRPNRTGEMTRELDCEGQLSVQAFSHYKVYSMILATPLKFRENVGCSSPRMDSTPSLRSGVLPGGCLPGSPASLHLRLEGRRSFGAAGMSGPSSVLSTGGAIEQSAFEPRLMLTEGGVKDKNVQDTELGGFCCFPQHAGSVSKGEVSLRDSYSNTRSWSLERLSKVVWPG